MFCPKCGKEVKDDARFCPECGAKFIASNIQEINEVEVCQRSIVNKKNSKKIFKWILGIIATILVIMIFIGVSDNNKKNKHITLVKSGYLGEFTDATVDEILDNMFNLSGFQLKWSAGKLDGKEYVGFHAYLYGEDPNDGTTILFEICTDETFKISEYAVGGSADIERTEIAGDFNFWYAMWYMKNEIGMDAPDEVMINGMQELIYNKFDKVSGSAVLYGASKDYSGDRGKLCEVIDGSQPLDMSVTELINYYYDNTLEAYTSVDLYAEESEQFGEVEENYSQESTDFNFNNDTNGGIGIDYSLWINGYIRNRGPAASFTIVSIDENGIVFTAGIGASGYLSYLDMREFAAKWVDTYTAVYDDGSGYKLTITLNNDGGIILNDNQPYYGGLGLTGLYSRATEAVYPDCEFVFAHSSYAYISSRECEGLNETECKIARNEIYA